MKKFEENIDDSNYKESKKTYKKLKDKEEKDQYINTSMKKFRTFIGGICLLMFALSMFEPSQNINYKENLTSGVMENINI